MGDEQVCVICRDTVSIASLNRICEHNVCDLCHYGELAERVAGRGWELAADERFPHDNNGQTYCRIKIDARLPRPIIIQARFRRESRLAVGVRLVKLFGQELQVGDPHFDDRVFIRTKTPDETAAFLRSRAAQAAIQEILWQEQGNRNAVEIRDGRLRVRASSTSTDFGQEAQVFASILLHQLEGFMEEATGERGPYR